jgi:carbonic anhydrase
MSMLRNKISHSKKIIYFLVQISTVPGPISVSGGGLPGTYIFDQMHFHWASEHTLNGGR